jgi:hypothetical protein
MELKNPPNKQAQLATWRIAATIPVTLFNNACLNIIQLKKTSQSKTIWRSLRSWKTKKTPPVFILVRKKKIAALFYCWMCVVAFGYILYSFREGSLLSIIAPILHCFSCRAEPKGRVCFTAALLATVKQVQVRIKRKALLYI